MLSMTAMSHLSKASFATSEDLNYNNPFLANSIFRAASPALKPPLLAQTAMPSPSSTLSSTIGCGHGQ